MNIGLSIIQRWLRQYRGEARRDINTLLIQNVLSEPTWRQCITLEIEVLIVSGDPRVVKDPTLLSERCI
ncbi:MAG: hypothetical protein E7H06_01050 [Enterobacter asburiae]|nr:hypothetical protein [Enterobacter asburiae]